MREPVIDCVRPGGAPASASGPRWGSCTAGALLLLWALSGTVLASPAAPSRVPPVAVPGPSATPTSARPAPSATPAPSPTPAGPPLSLQEAMRVALLHNPTLASQHELVLAAKQRELQAQSHGLPFVGMESVAKDGPRSAPGLGFTGLANSSVINNFGGDVYVTQVIADFGRVLHNVRQSRYLTEAARLNQAAQEFYVALLVYQTYDNVLKAQRLLVVAHEDVASRSLLLKQTQARFDAGLTSRVDVDLARSGLAQSEVGEIQAGDQLQQSFADLNDAMGLDRSTQWSMEDLPVLTAPVPPINSALEADVQSAVKNRPEMQALSAQMASLQEKAKAAAADGRPLLRGVASVGSLQALPSATTTATTNQPYAVGLLLTWPLYTGGLIQAEVAEAKHQAQAVSAQRDQLEDDLRQQVTKSRLVLEGLIDSQQSIQEQLTASQDAVKLAMERYEFGLGNLLDVQQAQLLLLTAEENEARLRYDIETAQAALRYATGTLALPLLEGRSK